jgi:hypothetical protein
LNAQQEADVRVRSISSVAAVLSLGGFLVAACERANPIGPTQPLNQQFVLAPGQSGAVDGTSARVQFVEVANESRCPLNAICIQAGDATIAVSVVDDQGSNRYELRVNDPTRKSVMHRDLRVEFVDLRPYPDTSRPTAPGDYRATLRVVRQ